VVVVAAVVVLVVLVVLVGCYKLCYGGGDGSTVVDNQSPQNVCRPEEKFLDKSKFRFRFRLS
jgi:hypothetical protein